MRRIFFLLSLSLLVVSQAYSQYSGQLSTASTIPIGTSRLGVYSGVFGSNNYDGAISILGQYRYGMADYTDIGFKLAVLDFNKSNDAGIDISGDLKYRIMDRKIRDPFDLSIGGVIELVAISGSDDIYSLGINAIGSYPINLSSNHILEPYGRLLFRGTNANDHFDINLNIGSLYDITNSMRVFGEIQFVDPAALFLGVDFDL